MSPESDDPRAIRSLAVTADDVVTALEARQQRDRTVVLRVTPPFSGRMRGRLHVPSADRPDGRRDRAQPGDSEEPGKGSPVHVDPERLVDDDAPPYPRPADTEDRLRSDPDTEYTVDRHHERHRERVVSWRERVRDHFAFEVEVEVPDGTTRVELAVLG